MSDTDSGLNSFLPQWLGGDDRAAARGSRAGGGGAAGTLQRLEQFGRGVRRAAPSVPESFRAEAEAALEAAGRLVATARARSEAGPATGTPPDLEAAAEVLQRLHFHLVRLRVRRDEVGEEAGRAAAAELEAVVEEARRVAAGLDGNRAPTT